MTVNIDIQNRQMDIPVRRLADLQKIGKIPADAVITNNGDGTVHVEFKIKK